MQFPFFSAQSCSVLYIGVVILAGAIVYMLYTSPFNVNINIDMAEKYPLLSSVLDATSTNVRIRNPDEVELILQKLFQDGRQNLQVVTDFDLTLTKFHDCGKPCLTTYAMLDNSTLMPDNYIKRAKEMKEIYLPVLLNETMTLEEKKPHLMEWYTKAHQLLSECGITEACIATIAKHSHVCLREHTCAMLDMLYAAAVPVLVYSGGLGNIVDEILRQNTVWHDNIEVISNYMDFDEEGVCVGFKGNNLIHAYNKDQLTIHLCDYFETSKRKNLILLGDSLGDTDMANGAKDVNALLKIGFLNDKIEERSTAYMDKYDIVLIDDQTMTVVVKILNKILFPRPSAFPF